MREIKSGSYEIDKSRWGNGNPIHIGGFSFDKKELGNRQQQVHKYCTIS